MTDDERHEAGVPRASQSAFVRGFIDDEAAAEFLVEVAGSQSAFVRGFIDDWLLGPSDRCKGYSLNPRSCAASSMTWACGTPRPSWARLNPRSCAASSMTRVSAANWSAAV